VDVAALIAWILTAGAGFFLLGTWIAKRGKHRRPSRFPSPLIFGHFLLAATGLVLWIAYVAVSSSGLGWTAFALLLLVAVLGFTMLARWIPVYQASRRATAAASATGYGAAGTTTAISPDTSAAAPERHFPVAVVAGHGLLAATTLVLVLLTMIGVGGG
jgi:hypothetical protein